MAEGFDGSQKQREGKLKEISMWITILTTVAVGLYTGYNTAEGYFDRRYILRHEALTVAQAADIEEKVAQVSMRSAETATKLGEVSVQTAQIASDFRLYSATVMVNQARAELRAVEQSSDGSYASTALRASLQDRLLNAEQFRNCVLQNGGNCNVLLQ